MFSSEPAAVHRPERDNIRSPKCSSATGSSSGTSPRSNCTPCGSSAPRRWCARGIPTRGMSPPAVFLPDAEEDDMLALTERVILTALGDWEHLRRARRVAEARGQRAGVGLRQIADRAHAARGAAARGELAGPDPGSHRGPDHPRSRSRQRRRRRVARAQLHARARRFRRRLFVAGAAARNCRSASSRSTAAM